MRKHHETMVVKSSNHFHSQMELLMRREVKTINDMIAKAAKTGDWESLGQASIFA